MKQPDLSTRLAERKSDLRRALLEGYPAMQRRAVLLDASGAFPEADIAWLRNLGVLASPLPVELGGLGLGTDPEAACDLMHVLRLIGRGNLCVGRLYEAHVNAIRLVTRYGTDQQIRMVAAIALEGHLFGLWVTDAHHAPLRCLESGLLDGCKAPCSGAGYVDHAIATATMPGGETRLLFLTLDDRDRVDFTGWDTHGMVAAKNGSMNLAGLRFSEQDLIGNADDYLREPDFSAGAWRTSAVTLGGIEALVGEMRRTLVSRGRASDPNQAARVGQALIAEHTARLWVKQAAIAGEAQCGDPSDRLNIVNLARIAVEASALTAIPLVQRSLGMAAFKRGTLTELLFRDLAMYLRQPAPDEALSDAAAHFMQRDLPAVT